MHKSSINLQFEKLEQSKHQLLDQLAALDTSVLHFHPAHKKWSIAQIIFHLNSSESNSVNYIAKKSQGGTSIPKSSYLNSLRSFLLTTALKYLKWKKPAALPDPPENLDIIRAIESWNETRVRLKELIEKLPDDMLTRNIFRHPAAGRMNMNHALTFMQEHFNHHLKQIEDRILMAGNFT